MTAIAPLSGWPHDERLSAFAGRTLLKMAETSTARVEVIDAFRSVDLRIAPATTAKDVIDAMTRLGATEGSRSVERSGSPHD